ncbi:hypothetical protein [Parvularcula bermudensis]|nr:hypothetical protein [Parvularcula bermudensis]
MDEDGPVKIAHATGDKREALLGDLYRAKVLGHDPRLGAAFVDLGTGGEGFLRRPGKLPPVGATLIVEIKREAMGAKGPDVTDKWSAALPLLRLTAQRATPGPLGEDQLLADRIGPQLSREGEPGRIDICPVEIRLLMTLGLQAEDRVIVTTGEAAARLAPFLGGVAETLPMKQIGEQIDLAEEEALRHRHIIPGGGALTIEETEAAFTVDLDLAQGAGQSKAGAGSRLLAEAMRPLGRLLSLAGAGGQILIDAPRGAIAAPKIFRDQLTRALKPLGRVSVPAVTPEGCALVVAPRPRPSTLMKLTEPFGQGVVQGRRMSAPVARASAYRALAAALERNPTAQRRLVVAPRLAEGLVGEGPAAHLMRERYGPRFEILVDRTFEEKAVTQGGEAYRVEE